LAGPYFETTHIQPMHDDYLVLSPPWICTMADPKGDKKTLMKADSYILMVSFSFYFLWIDFLLLKDMI
jgi:hypothetical protein